MVKPGFLEVSPFPPTVRSPTSADFRFIERRGLGICTIAARKSMGTELRRRLSAMGLPCPDGQQTVTQGQTILVSLGPDRWLALAEGEKYQLSSAMVGQLGDVATIIEQSDGYCVVRVTGRHVLDVLARGIPIDLAANSFPPKHAACTSIGHINVTLWRLKDKDGSIVFDLAFPRSYALSFLHWLDCSSAPFNSAPA